MSGRVLNPRSTVPFLPWRSEAVSGARRLLARLRGASVVARWRWRRFVVRRRRVLVPALLGACLAGWAVSPDLFEWSRGTVFSGRDRVWGQVVVRPLAGGGVVCGAGVRLVPAGVWSFGAALHLVAGGEAAGVVRAGPDFAGRWSADGGLVAGWRYAVLVEAEDCPPRLAGTVEVGWFAASRVDLMLSSCRGRWSSLELLRLP